MIRFDCITLFPEMFAAVAEHGITRRARELGIWSLQTWNPRQFATDNYRTVDDRPYGGGPGMVMMAQPLSQAVQAAREANAGAKVVHLSPQGRVLDHARVCELAGESGVILLCGRYEGLDERFVRRHVDEELSIGDYVLSGGELAAMVLMDAVIRQMPGVLGDENSAAEDSFARSGGLLDCPHYTRPEVWDGESVPAVLMSGHHAQIERWRLKQALGRTWQRRPDVLERRGMSSEEAGLLEQYRQEMMLKQSEQQSDSGETGDR